MATYFRGLTGPHGLVEDLTSKREALANRLVNDDKRRDRGERSGLMNTMQRTRIEGEIAGLNTAILVIRESTVLSHLEYDHLFGSGQAA